jgi:hypothetical protein
MARPEHLPCVNTVEGIHRINEMQDAYDKDPERWEWQEQQALERHQMEQDEIRMQEAREYEYWQEQKEMESNQIEIDDLPF